MTERYIHYSAAPLGELHSTNPLKEDFPMKPFGLWFSVEIEGLSDGWKEWCEIESFALDALAHQTEIIFKEDARILRISNIDELDEFTKQYNNPNGLLPNRALGIKWDVVAESYQGIIIAPYIWERRLHIDTTWYYGWDCASGCVWDVSAIATLNPKPLIAVEGGK